MGTQTDFVRPRLGAYRDQDLEKYPCGDDEPMSETSWHGESMDNFRDLLIGLRELRGKEKEWFIVRDNFWYYQEGDGNKRFAPDVLFVPNVENAHMERFSWVDWLEGGQRPTVIYEVLSESTWEYNLAGKKDAYEALGVREYYVFDPRGDYVTDRFRGFRLVDGAYERIAPDPLGRLESEELGVWIWAVGRVLRMIDRPTGQEVFTRLDTLRNAAAAQARRAEAERQKAESERQRAEAERQKAESERQRAEAERQKAESERQRADLAEAKQEALRSALRAMGIDPDNLP